LIDQLPLLDQPSKNSSIRSERSIRSDRSIRNLSDRIREKTKSGKKSPNKWSITTPYSVIASPDHPGLIDQSGLRGRSARSERTISGWSFCRFADRSIDFRHLP
jgi:hypothetical protein